MEHWLFAGMLLMTLQLRYMAAQPFNIDIGQLLNADEIRWGSRIIIKL